MLPVQPLAPDEPLTPDEVAALESQIAGHKNILRLLNSGAGGIAQLRRIVTEKLAEANAHLKLATLKERHK